MGTDSVGAAEIISLFLFVSNEFSNRFNRYFFWIASGAVGSDEIATDAVEADEIASSVEGSSESWPYKSVQADEINFQGSHMYEYTHIDSNNIVNPVGSESAILECMERAIRACFLFLPTTGGTLALFSDIDSMVNGSKKLLILILDINI